MNKPNTPMLRIPTTDDIARAAYLDWVDAGKPSGCDKEFWLEAEARLRHSVNSMGTPVMKRPPLPNRPATTTKL